MGAALSCLCLRETGKALGAKSELGVLKLSLELLGNALNRMVLRNGDQWAMRNPVASKSGAFRQC